MKPRRGSVKKVQYRIDRHGVWQEVARASIDQLNGIMLKREVEKSRGGVSLILSGNPTMKGTVGSLWGR